jgi:hypothetical protein
MNGQLGELRFVVQITRKDTGKVEEVEMVGYLDEEKLKELQNANAAADLSDNT